jgi:type II secretory pathway pseudopilin PulG
MNLLACHTVCRRFSLVEILVVMVIISLIMAVVGGRVGRLPAGVVAKNATGQIQTAFRDAAARARATGVPVRVRIGGDDRMIRLETAPDALPAGPTTVLAEAAAETAKPDPEAAGGKPGDWFGRPMTYELPRGVEWQDANGRELPPEDGVFLFFPNGEAGGGPAWFSTGKRRFRLEVERLTGRPGITEDNR